MAPALSDQLRLDGGLVLEDEAGEGDVDGGGDAPQEDHREVAAPVFEQREVAFGEAGVVREHPARHPMAGAGVAHLLSDLAHKLGLFERAGRAVRTNARSPHRGSASSRWPRRSAINWASTVGSSSAPMTAWRRAPAALVGG